MEAITWSLERIYNYLCGARLLLSHCTKCPDQKLWEPIFNDANGQCIEILVLGFERHSYDQDTLVAA